MSPHIRCPLYIAIALPSLLATGCYALVTPLPPPATSIVAMDSVEVGSLEVGVGSSGVLMDGEKDLGTYHAPNYLGGVAPAHVGIALNERLTLTGTYGVWALGHSTGVGVSRALVEKPQLGLRLAVGSGLYVYRDSYQVDDPVLDENGEQVVDENGNPESTSRTVRYGYFGLAPNIGLQSRVTLNDRLDWLSQARLSYSATFNLYGLDPEDRVQLPYIEAGTGLQWEALEGLDVGIGIHTMNWTDGMELGGSVSVAGTFDRAR